MVCFEVIDAGWSNAEFLDEMLRAGVRMGEVRGQIRAVTHLDISAEDVELAIRAAADILQSNPRGMGSSVGSRTRTGY
jgi:threonine aldolase